MADDPTTTAELPPRHHDALARAAEYELLLDRLDRIDAQLATIAERADYLASGVAWLIRSVERFTSAAEAHPLAARFLRK